MRLSEILQVLGQMAPLDLAEGWDNVGLLMGDREQTIGSIMTCLTLTPDVAAEAIREGVSLIVSHHPVMFRPVQQLTRDSTEGGVLLDLAGAGIAVYSAHTGYDSAPEGINQQLAEALSLKGIHPLRAISEADSGGVTSGSGRYGDLADVAELGNLIDRIKQVLAIKHVQFIGRPDDPIQRLAIACGAAAEFLEDAITAGCDAFLTGEARFHDCLSARSRNVALILPGHYATERPAMNRLAENLARAFPKLRVWASLTESDPVQWS